MRIRVEKLHWLKL